MVLYKYIPRTLGCTCARPLSSSRMKPRLGVHGSLVGASTHALSYQELPFSKHRDPKISFRWWDWYVIAEQPASAPHLHIKKDVLPYALC